MAIYYNPATASLLDQQQRELINKQYSEKEIDEGNIYYDKKTKNKYMVVLDNDSYVTTKKLSKENYTSNSKEVYKKISKDELKNEVRYIQLN